MSAQRLTQPRLEAIAERLDDRDQAVIQTLATVRIATGGQLQQLHFEDDPAQQRSRQTRRVMQRLHDLGVVMRLDRRIGGVRSGSSGHIYGLDRAGQYVANSGGPARGRRLRRPWTPSTPFVRHALAVTQVYVDAQLSARRGGYVVATFDTEPTCWRRFAGPGGGPEWCKPDAFVVIELPESELSYFIEVDLGTHARPALARKFQTYRRYHASGAEQRRREVFPRVLWLTDTDRRRGELLDVAGDQPADSWRLFQIGLLQDATALMTTGPATQ